VKTVLINPGKGWSWRQRAGINFLVLEALEQTGLVRHGFSARRGGVSQAGYSSLNLGLHVGDDPRLVLENRCRFASALGVASRDLVIPAQVHGDQVGVVGRAQAGFGANDLETAVPGVDALITQEPELPLCTFYADCVPIFLFDPVRRVIGLAHAGWKGTVQKIGTRTLQRMQEVFGSKPEDCLAGIGPSIGPCCYEVDQPVIRQVLAAFPDSNKLLTEAAVGNYSTVQLALLDNGFRENRANLDLWAANQLTLLKGGILPQNIWLAGICTRCHPELFFSYRGANGQPTGRMGAVISLRIDSTPVAS
jgi:YfiH family protein